MHIVTCHFKEDLSWLENSSYPVHVIGKEGGNTNQLDKNKFRSVNIIPNFAKEAGSYLWYIKNNYHNLPEKMAFIHGHENSPHQKMPVFEAIDRFKDQRFADLNRHINLHVLIIPNSFYDQVWQGLMQPFFGDVPKVINCRGMAQFIVAKELIESRPIYFWNFLYEETLKICTKDPKASVSFGRFYETFWHIIFGADSLKEYVDIFVDSECKIYGPWQFIQAVK